MSCYHKITILDKRTGEARQVPCGKCIGCLQDYQNSWKIRITDELESAGYKGVYFTLTYAPQFATQVSNIVNSETGEFLGDADEYCKFSPFDVRHDRHRILTVNKQDVQSWLKRCRRSMEYHKGETVKYKYFITSEYGPNTLRPHYHGIFIGLDIEDFKKYFLDDWSSDKVKKYYKKFKKGRLLSENGKYYAFRDNKFQKGNVEYEEIVFSDSKSPDACADYISKYCSKGFFENPRVELGYVDKCFRLISKRFGLCKISDLTQSILQDYQECSMILNKEEKNIVKDFKHGRDYARDYYFGLLTNYNPLIHEKFPQCFDTGVFHDYYDDGSIKSSYYNTVFCLAPRLDFIRELVSRMYIVRYDKKTDKIFKYKLPRYYYDKLFPKNTAIRKAVANVLQLLSDEALCRELESLQSQWPNETPTQIYHRYLLQKKNKEDRAESKAIQYVARRYSKSIL